MVLEWMHNVFSEGQSYVFSFAPSWVRNHRPPPPNSQVMVMGWWLLPPSLFIFILLKYITGCSLSTIHQCHMYIPVLVTPTPHLTILANTISVWSLPLLSLPGNPPIATNIYALFLSLPPPHGLWSLTFPLTILLCSRLLSQVKSFW